MPKALGGAELAAGCLLRFVYMDESGFSKGDRHTVVAGVVVHADAQQVPLEYALEKIAEDYIPEEDRDAFFFRGADIYGGNGYFKGKSEEHQEFPFQRRLEILGRLAAIPAQLKLWIPYGHSDRDVHAGDPDYAALAPYDALKARTMLAHFNCVLTVEAAMRGSFPAEVAQLVVEDNAEMHESVRNLDVVGRHREAKRIMGLDGIEGFDLLPLTHIRGAVHFCEKLDSRILQLADVCAYLIRGKHVGGKNHLALYEAMAERVVEPVYRG